jgi:hypothetical protein
MQNEILPDAEKRLKTTPETELSVLTKKKNCCGDCKKGKTGHCGSAHPFMQFSKPVTKTETRKV